MISGTTMDDLTAFGIGAGITLLMLFGDHSVRRIARLLVGAYLLLYTTLPPSWQNPFGTIPPGSPQRMAFILCMVAFVASYYWDTKEA